MATVTRTEADIILGISGPLRKTSSTIGINMPHSHLTQGFCRKGRGLNSQTQLHQKQSYLLGDNRFLIAFGKHTIQQVRVTKMTLKRCGWGVRIQWPHRCPSLYPCTRIREWRVEASHARCLHAHIRWRPYNHRIPNRY